MSEDLAPLLAEDRWPGAPFAALPAPVKRGAYIYFVRCLSPDGHIKIGYAKDLAARLSSIQNGCPYEVAIVAYFWTKNHESEESNLHHRFRAAHVRGEWFQPMSELRRFIYEIGELRRRAFAREAFGAVRAP